MNVKYAKVRQPDADSTLSPVLLSDQTMAERQQKVLQKMKENEIDSLVIYADLEHGSNFEYLTGFLPRFEEALLILHQNGDAYMIMGNENLNKVPHARIKATAIHCPHFSLPNQPMDTNFTFLDILKQSKLTHGETLGVVGWKLFTSHFEDNQTLFDLPNYIIVALRAIVGERIVNATSLFIGENGVRCINNVNEIEHYEFGASLASDCILKAMNAVKEGISEMELGGMLNAYGQKNSVITIAASGPRFIKANLYPTDHRVQIGDTISLTVGYKGGLSSRTAYAVENATQLPADAKDYINVVVKPYYHAIVTWLTNIHCGMKGKELYAQIEEALPKQQYHWTLCPGHLCADEEWLSSCIYETSEEKLQSGMILQTDIIPSVPGYAGSNVESTVLLADAKLRHAIKEQAPALWDRMQKRRNYLIHELHIPLSEDVLPMCSTLAYLRPFLMNKEMAMCL